MTSSDSVPAHVWLRSPAIKAWKQPERTLAILSELAAAWLPTGRLVLEVLVARHAGEVAERCAGLEVLSGGVTPPPRGWLARTLGLGRQTFVAKIALRSPEELQVALAGDAIWDSDFMLSPRSETGGAKTATGDSPVVLGSGVEWASVDGQNRPMMDR